MAKRAQTRVGVRSKVAGGIEPDPRRDATIVVRTRAFGAGAPKLHAISHVMSPMGSGWRS